MKIGFVGLGIMGNPMAANLIKGGHELHLYSLSGVPDELVKAGGVAEVFTPVAGEIVEVNEQLADDPELLNDDPHGEGWLVKVRVSSDSDLKSLMNAEEYEEYTSGKG